MTPQQTNVDRLIAAGCCKSDHLSAKDRERLNSLDKPEVDLLISLHQKLGTADSDSARPAFPV